MYRIVLLLLFCPLFTTCEKADLLYKGEGSKDMPMCIREIIDRISEDQEWNPPARIYSYLYHGETVYFIPQRCCDIPSLLLDSDCNIICSPDGGFSGNGDGRCTDFFSERSHEKLIWEDKR